MEKPGLFFCKRCPPAQQTGNLAQSPKRLRCLDGLSSPPCSLLVSCSEKGFAWLPSCTGGGRGRGRDRHPPPPRRGRAGWLQALGQICPSDGRPEALPAHLVEKAWLRRSARILPVFPTAPSVSRKSRRGWPRWMCCRRAHFRGGRRLLPPMSARIFLMLSQAPARFSCRRSRGGALDTPRKGRWAHQLTSGQDPPPTGEGEGGAQLWP